MKRFILLFLFSFAILNLVKSVLVWGNVGKANAYSYMADAKDTNSEKNESEKVKFKNSSEQTDRVESYLTGKYFTFNSRSKNYIFDFIIPTSFYQKCVEYPPDVLA